MRGKRRVQSRRGRALRSLGLALALYLCFQWVAGYRLLPWWVRGMAQDENGLEETRLVAGLGGGLLEGRYQFYLSAGEERVLFFSARHIPLLGWRLAWAAPASRKGQRGETLIPGAFTLRNEETGGQEIWVFGEVTGREVAEVVLYGTATNLNWSPPDLGELTPEEWERLEPRELARLGGKDWIWSQNRRFFAWNSILATQGGRRSWEWLYAECYDASGALIERAFVGNWNGGAFS